MSVSKAIEKGRKEVPILGEVVSWNLYGIEFPEEPFGERYQELELPTFCYYNRRVRSALTKTLKVMEKHNLIRRVGETETEVTFLIVEEHKQLETRDIDFHKKNAVTYDKITKSLEFRHKGPKEEEFREMFEKYRHLITGREISRIFVRLATTYGIPLQSGGGTYFIPKSSLFVLDKMDQLLEGTGGTILRLGISDLSQYRDTMTQVVRRELLGEVKKFEKEVKKLEVKYADEGIKESVLDRKISRVRKFAEKPGLFQGLGIDAKEIQDETLKCMKKLKNIRMK